MLQCHSRPVWPGPRFPGPPVKPTTRFELVTYHLPSGCATVCATWAHPRWSHPSDLNRRPNAYKALALPAELGWPIDRPRASRPKPATVKWRLSIMAFKRNVKSIILLGGGGGIRTHGALLLTRFRDARIRPSYATPPQTGHYSIDTPRGQIEADPKGYPLGSIGHWRYPVVTNRTRCPFPGFACPGSAIRRPRLRGSG